MCIVDVDLHSVRQLVPFILAVFGLVVPDDHADAGSDEEVLLSESQLLADTLSVIRIEDACDSLDLTSLLHCLAVVAGIEGFHVDGVVYRLCIPQMQCVDCCSAKTEYRYVVRYRSYGVVVNVLVFHLTVFISSLYSAPESYDNRLKRFFSFP